MDWRMGFVSSGGGLALSQERRLTDTGARCRRQRGRPAGLGPMRARAPEGPEGGKASRDLPEGDSRNGKQQQRRDRNAEPEENVAELLKEVQLTTRTASTSVMLYKKLHKAIEVCFANGDVPLAMNTLAIMESHMKGVRKSTYAVVARRLAEFREVDLLEKMIEDLWRKGESATKPDERLCALAINAAFSTRRNDVALRLFEGMKLNTVDIGSLTFSVMSKGYGRMGQPLAVRQLLDDATQRGVHLDVVAWNSAIDALVRCGRTNTARELIEAMKNDKVAPNETTFNTLIKGAGRAGRIDEAFDILTEMRQHDCLPNHVTKNSLIDACMRVGLWNRACEILEGMMNDENERRYAVVGYTAVCAGMVKVGRSIEGLGLMDEMQSRGVPPDVVTYNSMINALLSSGQVDQARKLYKEAVAFFGARQGTCGTMIVGLCSTGNEKFIREAENLLRDAPKYLSCYNAVIDGYVKIGLMHDAERVFAAMKEHKNPNVITYTTLFDGYGRDRDLPNALRLFNEMCKSKISPDLVAFNALISSFVRCGNVQMAVEIYDEMAVRNGAITPDIKTYSILVQGQLFEGFFEQGWELFDTMIEHGLLPNERMLSSMMRKASEVERVDTYTLWRILREMRAIGMSESQIDRWEERVQKKISADKIVPAADESDAQNC